MRSLKEKEESSGNRQLTIFVDANTIVSGLIFEGNEALLLRLGRIGLCRLVTTRHVVEEVARVLKAPEFNVSEEEAISFLSYINSCVRVYGNVKPAQLSKYLGRLEDKKDAHVFAAFDELKSDILVTGDKELLRKISGAKTTRQALKKLLGEE